MFQKISNARLNSTEILAILAFILLPEKGIRYSKFIASSFTDGRNICLLEKKSTISMIIIRFVEA